MKKLIPLILDKGDHLTVGLTYPPDLDKVPPIVYTPGMTKDGPILYKDREKFNIPDRIYGDNLEKLAKLITGDHKVKGNSVGAILDGKIGMGKSLLAELCGNVILDKKLPVIYVSQYFPPEALLSLLKVTGPCALIIEEFERTYHRSEDIIKFISILSDTSLTGVLFILISNNIFRHELEPLRDRPQRCKYRINFGKLDDKLIDSIVDDNVAKEELRHMFKDWARNNDANVDSLVTLIKMSQHIEDVDDLVEYIGLLNIPKLSDLQPAIVSIRLVSGTPKHTDNLEVDLEKATGRVKLRRLTNFGLDNSAPITSSEIPSMEEYEAGAKLLQLTLGDDIIELEITYNRDSRADKEVWVYRAHIGEFKKNIHDQGLPWRY